ncbi:MAG TPA: RHS repeat-associated core domain-containing protein, partial [Anaerolineales bacterium]|nr:RHS repeat-associated core domain-containing protein [Anaerolineales bacterium]
VTTYFIGSHYEVTGSTITKYYFAGNQRVAMRTNTTLYYLLSDHLGSTSLTTNVSGAVVSELRYKAWGETRYASGSTPTKYQFTGQYSNMNDFGLLFYHARWYDPYLNHFIQPDTIVPNLYNPQDWNRYSYARYNPLKYTDPSGHAAVCEAESGTQCTTQHTVKGQISDLKKYLKERYGWNIKGGGWTLNLLQTMSQVGLDIETYVDGLTGNQGLAWMKSYLSGINIRLWSTPGQAQTVPNWLGGMSLPDQGFDKALFAHELGHVWDMNTGTTWPQGVVGGVADSLNDFIGGNLSFFSKRYENDILNTGVIDPNIPSRIENGIEVIQFSFNVLDGYGNGSTADYLAESFAWNVVNRANTPIIASLWVDQAIIAQAGTLP